MKTGKTLVRVLAVILLLSMLVGFTPAMPAASQDDGGAVVLADPVDGEDNGGTTPGEIGDGNTGSGEGSGTEPGEGSGTNPGEGSGTNPGEGSGTEPGEGSGTEPGEGGGTEPEIKKVAVTFDGNVTVMAGESALESGAEVEVGTELAITVKTANVASAILVNGKECGGKYTVSDKDEAVSVTAFGITATKVEPDGWTKDDKTVTVNTFGENVTVNGTASNGKVTFTQSENGTFTAVAKCGDASVTVPVNVEQIDKTAPKMDAKSEDFKIESERKGNRTEYTIPVIEEGSGFDKSNVKITGVYYFANRPHNISRDELRPAESSLAVKDNVITFTGLTYHEGILNDYTIVYSITITDKAGNSVTKSIIELLDERAGDAGPEGVYGDFLTPEIKDETFAPEYRTGKENEVVWVGPQTVLTLQLQDTSEIYHDAAAIESVVLYKLVEGEDPVQVAVATTEINKETQTNDFVEATAVFPAGTFKNFEDGQYQLVVKDSGENQVTSTYTFQYDGMAPNVQKVELDQHLYTAYENVVHALTGGVMFKDKVHVTVTLNEPDTSDVQSIIYSFGGGDTELSEEGFKKSADGLTYSFNAKLPKNPEATDVITVVLVDALGNETTPGWTVTYVAPTEDGSKVKDATFTSDGTSYDATYDGTTYDNGKLTVFAYYTPQNAKNPVPYTGDWTKSVEFDVRYNTDELRAAEAKQKPEKLDANSEWCEVVYDEDISLEVTPDGAFSDSAKPEVVAQKDADGNTVRGAWNVAYGVHGDVACDGTLTFTVEPKVTINYMHTVERIEKEPDKNKPIADASGKQPNEEGWTPTYETMDVSYYDPAVKESKPLESAKIPVSVKVQNFLEPAVIKVVGTPTEDGWFNGLDHQLENVTVTAPRSKAPIVTEYTLVYAPVNGNGKSKTNPIGTPEEEVSLKENVQNTGDGCYTVQAVTNTNGEASGLNLSTETKDVSFKYDVTPAQIWVGFTEDKHQDTNGNYYDIQRTATVKITDSTFTRDDVISEEEGPHQIKVEFPDYKGAEPVAIGDWQFNAENNCWWRQYTYGVVGDVARRDGDNYQMTVTVTDTAGNKSNTDKEGVFTGNGEKDTERTHYGEEKTNPNLFNVDQTAPVVSVSFNNNNVRNGKYFNAARTATITVVEHNFDEHRVTLDATGASAGATASEGWTKTADDTYVKTVTFGRDANCKFSIDVVDKAGNVCPNANVRYSGVATADFVIDMTRPNVQYTGVDASPYGEACTPGFTATDTNLGNEFTYKLSRKTMKGEEDVSNLLNHAGSAARFSYSDIPNSRDDDGIYTFTCSVTDLAGNVTTLNPVEFAVNRHGSVYLLNKELQNVVGKYFNEEGWAKVDDGNLVITEYNPTPLKDDAKLEIYRDGTRVATYTGEALKKLVSGGDRGGLGLYEYAYKLPAADFAEDGSYRVVLSSTDANDHKSGNDKTGAEINFVIDTVSPEIVSISGLEKRTVNAEEQPVGFHILDTYGLDSVAIRTAGPDGAIVKEYISQAKYDAQNGKLEPYQQLLPEGELDLTDEIILIQNNTPYHVVISVTDKAGNTTVADGGSIVSSTEAEAMTPSYDFQDSVTVSTNFFVRYIHNTGALIGTGVGAAALAGLWLVLAKRKKDDEEKKTA